MKRLKNKVALVTGGAAGLGEAIVRALAAEGAQLVISDIDAARGERLAAELNSDFIQQDVADEQQWDSVIEQIEAKHSALHILVNNAAIEGPEDRANATPETTSLDDWRAVQRINVDGVFLGCRTAIPLLRRSGGGSIINISSIAALAPTPQNIAYGMSKAAVRHITQSVAQHCARDGSKIRCNSVHPGVILTPMLKRIIERTAKLKNVSYQEEFMLIRDSNPQKEFQTPEDIASAVVFLALDETAHMTGTKLVVDGGYTMGY